MEVQVLQKTENPERLVCQAARGDYFEGYVGDTEYAELMESVDWDEDAVIGEDYDDPAVLNQKTKAFCEKQLSRGHYGPWEHPQITFAVKGISRVTMAQITRHRHLSFDVQSMRYADFSEQDIVTPKSITDPDHFSREDGATDLTDEEREEWEKHFDREAERAVDTYQEMVADGIPKEDARFILPLGTSVNMTFSGNARSMMHVLNLRQKANAQWEVRELSNKVADELEEWMPYTGQWWQENGPMQISP